MNNALPEGAQNIAIQLRLRRVTVEYGYASVEVAPDLIQAGSQLDVNKLMQRAIEMGQSPLMVWYGEGQEVDPHPTQQQRESHEQCLVQGKAGFELI
ncbi:MAG: hypothetical protein SF097_27290 [Acidobacteriota bacterium]|nr:hypothetical protein [Acidobacteriota bacterium]